MLKVTSKDNLNIKYIQKLVKSSKFRRCESAFVIEGARLCKDAFLSNVDILLLVATDDAIEKNTVLIKDIENVAKEKILVPNSIFKLISDTKTPQGILCVCKINRSELVVNNGKFCALENVQDPVNLGTILRTAEALGINGIVISADCCDIYSPKVVRGSMGAIFRVPFIITENFVDYIDTLQKNGATCFASTPCSSAQKITKVNFNNYKTSVVLIGNEGNGLTNNAINTCKSTVTIPMLSKAESLNASVAASILMWEMLRSGGNENE